MKQSKTQQATSYNSKNRTNNKRIVHFILAFLKNHNYNKYPKKPCSTQNKKHNK
jgi:IS1 family transposase